MARSTDNGRTWTASNLRQVVEGDLGSGRLGIQDIGIAPGETGHVFAAVAETPEGQPSPPKGGLYESTDSGANWAATGLKGLPVNTVGFGVTAGGTVIYAGVGDSHGKWAAAGGVYTSTVGNTSVWHQTGITNAVILKLRVDPSNPLVVYAGGGFASPQDPVGALRSPVLYKTTDGGATWRDIRPELPQDNAVRALAIDPLFPNNVFFSFKSKVYQSVDGGNTWSLFSDADLGGEWVAALLVPLAAPSPVATFTAAAGEGQTVLRWQIPGDSDLAGVTVRYSTQGFPLLSNEGITLTTVAGSPGATGAYTHTDVVTGTTYYYSAFAYNQAGRYSEARQAASQPGVAAAALWGTEAASVQPGPTPARRLGQQTGTRSLFAATGGGLFARTFEGAAPVQKTYIPYLAKDHAAGW